MKPTGLVMAGIAAGAIVAACGDDTRRLTKEKFIEQADAICAETNEVVAPVFEAVWADTENWDDPTGEPGPSVFVRFDQAVDEVMPHFERQLDQLRGFDPPLDDEELIARLLDDHDVALAESAELVEAAAGGDEAAMATLESDDPFADVDRRMREYDMTVCGADG